jgi:hypothetical protein
MLGANHVLGQHRCERSRLARPGRTRHEDVPAGAGIAALDRDQLAGRRAPERDLGLEKGLAMRTALGEAGTKVVGGTPPRPGGALAVAADPQVLQVGAQTPAGGGRGGGQGEDEERQTEPVIDRGDEQRESERQGGEA